MINRRRQLPLPMNPPSSMWEVRRSVVQSGQSGVNSGSSSASYGFLSALAEYFAMSVPLLSSVISSAYGVISSLIISATLSSHPEGPKASESFSAVLFLFYSSCVSFHQYSSVVSSFAMSFTVCSASVRLISSLKVCIPASGRPITAVGIPSFTQATHSAFVPVEVGSIVVV